MTALPLVPDLNIWPSLVASLVSAAAVGALVGGLDRAIERRRARRDHRGAVVSVVRQVPARISRKIAA